MESTPSIDRMRKDLAKLGEAYVTANPLVKNQLSEVVPPLLSLLAQLVNKVEALENGQR